MPPRTLQFCALSLCLALCLTMAHAADNQFLKDNAREYLALRQTLKATQLTGPQMGGPQGEWRGKSVELFGRILGRTNASTATHPVTVMLIIPGVNDLIMVDSLTDDPLLAVDQVVHILAELPENAKPTDHFLLKAIIAEADLPAAERKYAAAEAAVQHAAEVNPRPVGIALPAPSGDKIAKPSPPPSAEEPAAPQPDTAVVRPGTNIPKLPPLNASAAKRVGAWKKWVGGVNPRLSDAQLEMIVRSVLYYSALYGLDHRLSFAMIKCESNFSPTCTSSAGAQGLTQLMPFNSRDMGLDPWDIEQNVRGGLKYLSDQLHKFPEKSNYEQCVLGLACYNAGPGAVKRAGGVPNIPETVRYVKKVGDLFYQLWKSGMP